MPFKDVETLLEDILEACEAIRLFLSDLDFPAYERDLKTKRAVERTLQIISEAAYRLQGDAEKLCPTIDWRGVRGLGNVLRHEYHAVDDRRIWEDLTERLPQFHQAVSEALVKLRKKPKGGSS